MDVFHVKPPAQKPPPTTAPAATISSRFHRRVIREYSIHVSCTTWFPRAYIDHTGTLILDMKDTKRVRKEKLERGEF